MKQLDELKLSLYQEKHSLQDKAKSVSKLEEKTEHFNEKNFYFS